MEKEVQGRRQLLKKLSEKEFKLVPEFAGRKNDVNAFVEFRNEVFTAFRQDGVREVLKKGLVRLVHLVKEVFS